jgi:hypothetical protein
VPQAPSRQTKFLTVRTARLVLVAVCAALAGCSPLGDDSGEPPLPEASIAAVVLQPDDLTTMFTRFDEGPLAIADSPGGERADPERFGRTGGWKARYRRPGSAATAGPLVVESRVDSFESAGGAERELRAHRDELEEQVLHPSNLDLVEIKQLGDEAVALTQDADAPGTLVSHTVVWRFRNVSASVTANGFGGKLTLADVVALARAQQRRLAAETPDDE